MVIPAVAPHSASIAFNGKNKQTARSVNANLLSNEIKIAKKPSIVGRAARSIVKYATLTTAAILALIACEKEPNGPDPIKPPVNPPAMTVKTKVISMMDSLKIIPHLKSTGTTAVLPKEVDYHDPITGGDVKDEFLPTSTDDTLRIKKTYYASGYELGADNLKVYLNGDTAISESFNAKTNKKGITTKYFWKDGGVMAIQDNSKVNAYKYLPRDESSLAVKYLKNGIQVGTEDILKLTKVVF